MLKKIVTLLVLAIAINLSAQTAIHHVGADTSTIRTFSEKIGGGMSENVRLEENKSIQRILQMQIETNMDSRTVQGYVIQIYYGRLQKAKEIKDAFESAYPDQIVDIEYDTPDYKVFVGAYQTQEQAKEALMQLRQNSVYSGAFVRPKEIKVYR